MKRATIFLLLMAGTGCKPPATPRISVHAEVRHDVSLPLHQLPPAPPLAGDQDDERDEIRTPLVFGRAATVDPLRQRLQFAGAALQLATTFEGVGWNFPMPSGGRWLATFHPADSNGDVGPSHYVQVTNSGFAVFDKKGHVLFGPANLRTLFGGFGGDCEIDAETDPVVRYDALADRWILTYLANGSPRNAQCFAVSQTGDPAGAYYRYEFDYQQPPDFAKLSIWPDGYYVVYHVPQITCALDRASMLQGTAVSQQCFPSPNISGMSVLLPADLEGTVAPPAGSREILVAANPSDSATALFAFRVHIDWNDPSKSALSGPAAIAITPISNSFAGVPQPNTVQVLDPAEGVMHNRLVYRNFGDHESIVGSLGARSGPTLGVRWVELRMMNGEPALYEEGTYAPDDDHRFISSIAMDKSGGIGLAYSISSATTYPGARFTGRSASDPLGVMTQPEGVLVSGEGWQEHTLRWGDYGNLAVDPVDGCTFWYSAVYMHADSNASTFNFTQEYSRIGSFRLPSCVTAAANDFALVADPPTRTASAGDTVSFAISSRVAAGQTEPLQLTLNPLPAGVKAQLAASTMQSDGATTLSITPDATVSGTAMITVHAAGATASHDASVSIVVSTIPPSPAPPAPPSSGGTGPTSGGGCSSAPPDLWPILVLLAMTVRMRATRKTRIRSN